MKRAAVHTALPLISASQISTFRECQRKWAWKYIAKVEAPPHPSALLGTEVHDTQLGPYLLEGRPFDFTRDSGYIAAALLEYLPQPETPGMEVEKHFILPSPASQGRFAYQGYKDLWLPARCTEHEDCRKYPKLGLACARDRKVPSTVADFKTTSDLKWAKSEKALSVDVQAMLYATSALFETGAEEVDLNWLYTQTRGARKAKRVHLRVTSDEAIEQFKNIEATAVEMFEVRQTVTDPLGLPPSPSQCEAYGGCPYRDRCNLSPIDHLAALGARDFRQQEMNMTSGISEGTSSLLARLGAKKAAAQSGTSPAPAQAPSVEEPIASAAPSPSSFPADAAGINPPEKDLPPPERKRGPGRPKKEKEPLVQVPGEEPKQLELPFMLDYDKLAELVVDKLAGRLSGTSK